MFLVLTMFASLSCEAYHQQVQGNGCQPRVPAKVCLKTMEVRRARKNEVEVDLRVRGTARGESKPNTSWLLER